MNCTHDMRIVQRDGTPGRLKRAVCALRQLTVAYDRGYQLLLDEPAAPKARDYGQDKNTGSKPSSSAPRGEDTPLRVALVQTGVKLALAVDALRQWEWPGESPWEHPNPDCDPSDVLSTALHPTVIAAPVQQLRAMLSGLQTADWKRADPVDSKIVLDACSRIDSAVGHLRSAGLWEMPTWPQECDNCYAPSTYADSRCEACYRYKKANKRERPQHLWVA